jgi:hypothetical protein
VSAFGHALGHRIGTLGGDGFQLALGPLDLASQYSFQRSISVQAKSHVWNL